MDFPEASVLISGLTDWLVSKAFQTVISIYYMFFNSDCFINLRDCFLDSVDMFGQIAICLIMICLDFITILA